ncbi:MAG: hypothetical protein KC543_01650 [Myxococcales bacterium]|nr:hypothetical protein [Myxococcales bacterium]
MRPVRHLRTRLTAVPPLAGRLGGRLALVAVLALCTAPGCATVGSDIAHARRAYEQARYENALVWLEPLDRDVGAMRPDDRARYFYLRGMSEYRLGRPRDAAHYLALAREADAAAGHPLSPAWRRALDRALTSLRAP